MRADLRVLLEQLDILEDEQVLWGWRKIVLSFCGDKHPAKIGNVLAELDEMLKRPDIDHKRIEPFSDIFKASLWLITKVPHQASISAEAAFTIFEVRNDHCHAMLSKWLMAIAAWDSAQYVEAYSHLTDAVDRLRKLQKKDKSVKFKQPWAKNLEVLEALYALPLVADKQAKTEIAVLVELREDLRNKLFDTTSAAELQNHFESRFQSTGIDHDYELRTYFSFFRACIYFTLADWKQAIRFSRQAADEFRVANMNFNQAISHWLTGLCFLYSGDVANLETARYELNGAREILDEIQSRSPYRDVVEACARYLPRIKAIHVPAGTLPEKEPVMVEPVVEPQPEEPAEQETMPGEASIPSVETETGDGTAFQAGEGAPPPPAKPEMPPEEAAEKPQPPAPQVIQVIVPIWNQLNNHANPVFSPVTNNNNHYDPVFAPVLNGIPAHTHKGAKVITVNGSETVTENTPLVPAEIEDYADLPWLPVYHSVVQANIGNGFDWVEPSPEDNSGLSFVAIEGRTYQLESVIQGIHKIRIAKSKEYGLVKVEGRSMNAARPPIENGDYVLFYKSNDVEENVNRIVIASRPMEKGFSYLIKKLTKTRSSNGQPITYELVSLTHETGPDYDNLPLSNDHGILGVVVAVAKPLNG